MKISERKGVLKTRRTDDGGSGQPLVIGTNIVKIWSKFALKMVLRKFCRLMNQLDC